MGQSYAFVGSATRGEVCVLLYNLLVCWEGSEANASTDF